MGPGGFTTGFDNDVPHFDHRGHYQTHSTIERTRHKARRKAQEERIDEAEMDRGTSAAFGFFMLSGVLVATLGVPVLIGRFQGGREGQRRVRDGVVVGS